MSGLRRRSGRSVVEYCGHIDFVPTSIFMAGVGPRHDEVACFREAWGLLPTLIGCEPHPKTYQSIRRNFPGVLYNVALGTVPSGKTKLHARTNNAGGASVFAPSEGTFEEFIDVDLCSINSLLKTVLGYADLSKTLFWLDCEGSELEVLGGAGDFLPMVSMINVELTANPRTEGWPSPVEVDQCLREWGFVPVWAHTMRSVIGQYDCIYVKRELFKAEFCCYPQTTVDLL